MFNRFGPPWGLQKDPQLDDANCRDASQIIKNDDTFIKNRIFTKIIISYTIKLQILILYTPPMQNHYFCLFKKL